ncbi:HD family phosphohydrolase [Rubrobacter aplysinae]|uniref:HD family phosphohydrolase n=1 Tax=Rubrobacter aplysinae TaxID=909625 RepID=UPI00064C1BB8|nr:HDIG domain-containing metalloprotein [Rubrobacter aplysinae]
MNSRKNTPNKPGERAPGKSPARKVDELHVPQTRSEYLRQWFGRLPKLRLYLFLLFVTWLCLTALVSLDSRLFTFFGLQDSGQQYEVGNVAEEDVYAPHNITYDDPVATRQQRESAADQAPESYRQSGEVTQSVLGEVPVFFEEVRAIRSSDASTEEKQGRIESAAPFYLPESTLRSLVFVDSGQLDEVERYTRENLEELYSSTAVADDGLEGAPATVISVSEARDRLSEAARRDASGETGALVEVLSRGFLESDYVVDRSETQQDRDEAASGVQPVQANIQQGEQIISRGEIIDERDIVQLEALGVIGGSASWKFLLGIGLVIAAEMGVGWYFLERFGNRILRTKQVIRVTLAASLTILFTALARVFVELSVPSQVIPLAGLSIIGTILLGPRLMFLMVVISSVNVGIIAGNDFFLTAALLISSGFAIYTAVRVGSRTQLLWAGIFIALVTSVVMFAVSLIGESAFGAALWQGLLGLANGILSLMIAMALLPLLENAFNILTPMKLLELSDPGRPLIQKLLRKAPGTFSHSMQVGNLAENAAERIGADTLLARVGAYYHDVGKLEHPGYFIENQISGVNPHDELSPALSARIIRRHVKDGVEIGRAWSLPEEILDIIAQHHGTSRIEYFYRKALQEAPDTGAANGNGGVREADFRYGSLPKSKEAGIIMLADSVEAIVKSIEKPTPKRIEDVVEQTVHQKLDDGQFDECELTMREIHAFGEAIREAIIGFLGPRIEYPGSKESKEKPDAPAKSPGGGRPAGAAAETKT